jgi:hypothetical protein
MTVVLGWALAYLIVVNRPFPAFRATFCGLAIVGMLLSL